MPTVKQTEPTLSNLTKPIFGLPAEDQNDILQKLGKPHVDSFNHFTEHGLKDIIGKLSPMEFTVNNDRLLFRITNATLHRPQVPLTAIGVKRGKKIYPSECRQRAATYKGKFVVHVEWNINGTWQMPFDKDMGDIPIMIRSNYCNLNGLTPQQLIKHGEHEEEWGGYFIVGGHERLIRMLVVTRRNYPVAIKRASWKSRGALFSDLGVYIRCVADDGSATTNVLHFVTDGTVKLMFSYRKVLYYAPLILVMKCLVNYCDQDIYQKLLRGQESDSNYVDCIQQMLRQIHEKNLHTHSDCKQYLGSLFRVKCTDCPDWYTDEEIIEYLMSKSVLIHLRSNADKLQLLVFMTQKLFAMVGNRSKIEGADSVMMHELIVGGTLYQQLLMDKLESWLRNVKITMLKLSSSNNASATTAFTLNQSDVLKVAKLAGGLEAGFANFLATGNIRTQSSLGIHQDKGLTITPENINRMRYMSHFKAIHRGTFFQEMRTTDARQLLPDAWGFICPVHTPDGAPCGLLNHLTLDCEVTGSPTVELVRNIPAVLKRLGMVATLMAHSVDVRHTYTVLLDGRVIGYINTTVAEDLVATLRSIKITGTEVPNTLEIVLVPQKSTISQYPGLFLFSGPTRMMRPLVNLAVNQVELVGTFEQVYLEVCVRSSEFYPDVTTHMELSKCGFLSNLARLIPMPDCNQSPRNMYQCQMGKQTMGTPCHNWQLQNETKMYRLTTPTAPLFRPVHYDHIDLDAFPMGTNAIVAVISYTGYDMEDAMIINKSSDEFGFTHGTIYKSEFIQLEQSISYFGINPKDYNNLQQFLDRDGLPFVGRRLIEGEPFYSYFNPEASQFVVKPYSGKEQCYVDTVKLCGDYNESQITGGGSTPLACITVRVPRNPTIGDKYASRAGQKGICSQKWPAEDLPFTDSGLVPDIVFNPHGFPSRMTIAMMIETMAGKSAAVHGLVHDASPFKFTEDQTAIDHFGKLLELGGFNYYGTETMYSGIDGREMEAQIFFGIVHYQRLRHMVSDKWQVRSTGPIDTLYRQPLKGRKRGGGVRFGEMERDSLISHGASFLLQDRMLHCSDKTTVLICTACNSLLGPVSITSYAAGNVKGARSRQIQQCRMCSNGGNVSEIEIPYIYKFLSTELASCNIHVQLKCLKI